MAAFSIAFITPEEPVKLIHKVVLSENEQDAMKKFFLENLTSFYSEDDKGFHYFKEDFADKTAAAGSVIPV